MEGEKESLNKLPTFYWQFLLVHHIIECSKFWENQMKFNKADFYFP